MLALGLGLFFILFIYFFVWLHQQLSRICANEKKACVHNPPIPPLLLNFKRSFSCETFYNSVFRVTRQLRRWPNWDLPLLIRWVLKKASEPAVQLFSLYLICWSAGCLYARTCWASGVVIFVSGSPQEMLQRCVVSLTFLSPESPWLKTQTLCSLVSQNQRPWRPSHREWVKIRFVLNVKWVFQKGHASKIQIDFICFQTANWPSRPRLGPLQM